MIITRRHLSRRTFLRGTGTVLALPLLDAMIPALRAERLTAAAPVRRLGFVEYSLGVNEAKWRPIGEGPEYKLNEGMLPLAPHRPKFLVLSGLTSSPDRSKTDFHDRALASYLTGCEPIEKPRKVGVSVDQLAAQVLGKETQFASLELCGQELGASGGLCWKSDTQPLPFEVNPRRVFERLFGDSGKVDPSTSVRRQTADRSLLDAVAGRLAELKQRVGPADRRKLDEYVESIRDVERRIEIAMNKPLPELPEASRPAGVPDHWPDHVKLMYDLIMLAFQADLTRVFTFMYNAEASNMNYPYIGVTMQHHELSHHNYQPDKLDALFRINRLQSELFAYFLSKMEAVKEGNATLLDHSLILYGSDLSNPTVHSQRRLPIVLAGGAAGRVVGGRHVDYGGNETPLTNLHLTLLDKIGVPTEKLGDSTGKLNRLEV